MVRPKRRASGVRRYLPGGWAAEALPVNAFAIEHPAGLCLLDTGQTAAAAAPGHFPAWHPFFRLARFELSRRDEIGPALGRVGLDPASLRWVVLSHLHTDHVGGLGSLPAADVLVSRQEWERGTGWGGRFRGYLPQHWPTGTRPRFMAFDDGRIGPFPGSVDLAGDGRLRIVPTPGHTPGHVSLLVHADERTFLCAGDLAPSGDDLERVAPQVAAFCRRLGIVVLTSHDPDAAGAVAARSRSSAS